MSAAAVSVALQKGLPANIDAERFILGSVLLDDARFIDIAGILTNDDFALEKHRRIFIRMSELHERGEKIDRVTVANELLRYNELESVDGLSRREYEAIRTRVLARWWDTLARARAAKRLSRDGRERLIASSYVVLKSGLAPEGIDQATLRSVLGDELHDLIYGTERQTKNA